MIIELNNIYNNEEKVFIKTISYIKRNYLDLNFFNIFFKKKNINKILYTKNKICIIFMKKENLKSFSLFIDKKYSIKSELNVKNKELFIENFKFKEGNDKLIYVLKKIYEDYNIKIKNLLITYKKNNRKNTNKNIVKNINDELMLLYKKFYNNAYIIYKKKIKDLT
ncbi:hypothetical protein ACT2CC_00540 [Candidatus Vidania fulgoroideorum]